MTAARTIFDDCRRARDAVRSAAFARALQAVITPRSVVIDIGTGTGPIAILAARLGARKVYAIDTSESIHVAREIASANGLADRIEFAFGDSRDMFLPEPADVIVCDVRSALPGAQAPVLFDARRRFLAAEGIVIPSVDHLWVAVVNAPLKHEELVGMWRDDGHRVGLAAVRPFAVHMPAPWRFSDSDLRSRAACWTAIDYVGGRNPDLAGEQCLEVTSSGPAHGLCVWFDADLGNGALLTNRPGETPLVYGQTFFPWAEPVELSASDRVTVAFHCDNEDGEDRWRWRTVIEAPSSIVKARFDQDTRRSLPPREPSIQARAVLKDRLRIDRFLVGEIGSGASAAVIADRLMERFPGEFGSRVEALTRVARVSVSAG